MLLAHWLTSRTMQVRFLAMPLARKKSVVVLTVLLLSMITLLRQLHFGHLKPQACKKEGCCYRKVQLVPVMLVSGELLTLLSAYRKERHGQILEQHEPPD